MNFIRLKRANWVVVMAMLALPGALSTSCSKQTDPTEIVAPKSDKLTISVLGINEGDSNNDKKAKASSRNNSSGILADQKIYEFSDVDMAVSLGNTLPVKKSSRSVIGKSNSLTSSAGLKAAAPVADDVKYVVYIYDGNTLVASKELASGTAGTIEGLDPAASYTWVALSYSSSTAAPSLTPTSGSIDLPENTDVLYASGTVDLATDPSIGILFNHAFSRIGIELNTIGVFGEITGNPTVTVSGLDLATGSIDLISGDITAGATFTPTLSYADFENVDPAFNDAKIAYVYTASTADQNIAVAVQNLEIEHADGSLARTYFATTATFNSTITPELGKNHHVLLNVVESPLTTNYGGNEVKWGRSNLYYRGDNGGLRDYAFYANNQQTARGDGYFSFGGTIPMKFATAATEGDPCALVYPAGLWRQPTKADFSGLVRGDIELNSLTGAIGPLGTVVDATGLTGLLNIITNLLGNTVAVLVNQAAPNSSLAPSSPFNYGQYTISGGAPTSGSNAFGDVNNASNRLRFYYNGQIANVNVLQEVADGDGLLNVGLNDISADISGIQIANLNLPLLDSYGKSTALWTNQQGTNIVGLVGAGTWGYFGNAGRTFSLLSLGSRFHAANNTGELLNGVSLVGLDVLGTSFKNVRCVRN